jgi:hypothetical protein
VTERGFERFLLSLDALFAPEKRLMLLEKTDDIHDFTAHLITIQQEIISDLKNEGLTWD